MGGSQRAGSIALVTVLGLGLVACGGGSDSTSATTTTKGDATTTTTSGGSLGDFSGECASFVSAFAGASASIGSAFSGAPGDQINTAASYFDNVAGKLPKEIRADFAVFAAAYKEFARAIVDAHIDFSNPSSVDPDKLAALEKLSKAFDSPKVKQASANIQAYVDTHCKSG